MKRTIEILSITTLITYIGLIWFFGFKYFAGLQYASPLELWILRIATVLFYISVLYLSYRFLVWIGKLVKKSENRGRAK